MAVQSSREQGRWVIGWENAYWTACNVLEKGLRAEELRVGGALAERHEQALHGRPILARSNA